MRLFGNIWELAIEASPWLVMGLLAAALMKRWAPDALLRRWLGGGGIGPIVRAALIGTPLPLCSCSVIPAAMGLRRQGASRGSTVSFLIATPENGVDSLAVSYALLGPFMTVVRPVAAIGSAVFAGLMVEAGERSAGPTPRSAATDASPSCCCAAECGSPKADAAASSWRGVIRYAFGDLLDDIAVWLAVGIVLAGVMNTFIEPETLASWGGGWAAKLVMLVVGLPMYICATASTPVAAAMLVAGVSPGTVLVFLLAGPATNIGSIAIVRRELGTRAMAIYLLGVSLGAIGFGFATDLIAARMTVNVIEQAADAHEWLPRWVGVVSAVVLFVASIRPLRRRVFR